MKKLPLFKILFASLLIVSTIQNTYAVCTVGPPSVCTGSTSGGYTGTIGNDVVIIPTGASVSNNGGHVIDTIGGDDTVTLSGGAITSTFATGVGIRGGANNDSITVNSGSIMTISHGISGNGGMDSITINGGSITATTGRAINGGGSSDTITLNGGIISGNNIAINANGGDDIVNIGGNVIVNGTIRGGGGNDTLRFSMAVPEAAIPGLQAVILAANPNGDTITINGLTYTWDRFETLEANFSAIAPVPTLSEWSMFLLISLLGLIGLRFTKKSNGFF